MALPLAIVSPVSAAEFQATAQTTVTPTIQVAPLPPSFTDKVGTAEDTYTIPVTEGVDYLVNGVLRSAGTYPGTGTVDITTRAKPGYEISYTLISSWRKTFDSYAPTTSVAPLPPTFTDKSGTAEDTYTIPVTEGVDYLVNGVLRSAGTYPGTGTVDITTRAKPGYEISYTLISSWRKTFNSAVQLISVTPKEPVFLDKDGTAEDTYTIPTTTGVDYLINGNVKAAGTYPAVNYMEINARAQVGYEIPSTAASTWKPYWSSYSWATEVTPKAPVFLDKDGTAEDTYTIPTTSGVQYYVDGIAKAAGVYPGTGTVTVTARAKTAYRVVYGAASSWEHTFSQYVPPLPVTVYPAAATFVDEDGTAKDTYTIPTTEGVEYLVGGVVKPAGTYPGTGSVTVTYRALPGYTVPEGYILRWGHTFSDYVPPTTVRPAAATFVDEDGTAKDTYTIPTTEGVEYLVGGVVKPAGTYPGTGSVTVTYRALPGYTVPEGYILRWGHTFSDYVPPTTVRPAAATFVDEDGTAKDTYTIPTTEGVEYLVGGVVKPAGTYPGTGSVTVTYRALPGYTVPEGYILRWGHTFSDYVPPTTVRPAAATFVDEDGTAKDTYTIPTTEGVEYLVGGVVKPAGTYPGTGSVTVTYRALPGYTVPEGYILRWGHTFSDYVPPTTVRPAAATFVDEDGTAKDTYTIPTTWIPAVVATP